MGFVREKVYRLVWDDGELAGLEVSVLSAGVDLYAQIADCRDDVALADLFAPLVVSWNLEDSDKAPIAVSRAAVGALDGDMLAFIVTAWINAVVGVSPPLPPPSADGPLLAEGSIPMDVLSASPSS